MNDEDLLEYQRELRVCPRSASGHLPASLRARAAKVAIRLLERGEALTSVARSLGVSPPTVREWQKLHSPGTVEQPSALVPVRVKVVASAPTKPSPSRRLVSVTSPDGYRVDDLTVAEAAELLRALR